MTDDTPRRSNGSYTSQYDPNDFTAAVNELNEPTTSDVADAVGCGVGTAHRYLNQLADNDVLERTEKYGAVLWSHTD